MPFESFVMENILFKVAYPGCVHGQTALECAMQLHPVVAGRLEDIKRIHLWTYEWSMQVVNKKGPLSNAADRDHCLQYMVAVALLKGAITVEDFEDHVAADPRIDRLRDKMVVTEDARFTREFYELEKRSCANGIEVLFADGSSSGRVDVEYPLGHRRRRAEGLPLLRKKFQTNLERRFVSARVDKVMELYAQPDRFEAMAVNDFTELFRC